MPHSDLAMQQPTQACKKLTKQVQGYAVIHCHSPPGILRKAQSICGAQTHQQDARTYHGLACALHAPTAAQELRLNAVTGAGCCR